MQFKNNKIFFSPSDLIIFMGSQFASHMERSRLEDPNYSSLMDPEDALLKNLQKRGYEHEDAFLFSLIASGKKVIKIDRSETREMRNRTQQAMVDGAEVIAQAYLELDNLRSEEVGNNASRIASIPEVRSELIKFQKEFSIKGEGAVLDGRDIGTVILPNADLKIFVTAELNIRAERRYQDFLKSQISITLERVLKDLSERDHRDSNRQHAPLKISSNAHLIDTSELSIEAAIDYAIGLVKSSRQKF